MVESKILVALRKGKVARFATGAFLVALLALMPRMAGGESGSARIASAVIDRWAAAYTANDTEMVVSNYTPDAILLGTSSPISEGTEGVRKYFSRIPGSGNKVVVGERRMVVLADGVVQATGFYEFTLNYTGKPVQVPGRFTMIVVKRGNNWLIEHHHSSPVPKP